MRIQGKKLIMKEEEEIRWWF